MLEVFVLHGILRLCKSSLLSVKIDPKIKSEAEKVAQELGFSLSSVINTSLKELIRNKSVSFALDSDLKEALDDIKNGRTIGPFSTVSSGRKAHKNTNHPK